ncbi:MULTISPECIES: hypothetical protein [Actinosynnema]|uniref:Uncharacterized protein n=1 Tax=Actinosynnema pretiosum TaxID=42197 RepID=A0A290Z8W1_9PSEU|nr:hypothetical protein [Actinosynnema pretiosum]ATE55481.1 hypothetical protein CNX65_21145 [Actinosynnema pretiosum]
MALHEQTADTAVYEAALQRRGVDPTRMHELKAIALSTPEGAQRLKTALSVQAAGAEVLVARSRKMLFDLSVPVQVGVSICNTTDSVITCRIGGRAVVETTTSFHIPSWGEKTFYDVLASATAAAYGQAWRKEEVFEDYVDVPVEPGRACWLERETVMRTSIGADFIVATPPLRPFRLVGDYTGPGTAGGHTDRVTVRTRVLDQAMQAAIREAAAVGTPGVRGLPDGTVELFEGLATLLDGEPPTTLGVLDNRR